jgi:hypothetical protein
MYTSNQIALQTFLANGLVPTRSVNFAFSVATAKQASSKQLYWVDKLVNEILNPAPKAGVNANFDPSKIFKLFDNAQKKLRYPKINLKTDGGLPLRLNTSRSHPDCIFLGSGGFGTPTYGKLLRTGVINWYSKDTNERADVEAMIIKFGADPVKVSAEFGKLNHNCCYCSKGLDTPESLAVGYGPVCAKHFDLPWGTSAPRTKPNIKELVNETGLGITNAAVALHSEMNELLVDQ